MKKEELLGQLDTWLMCCEREAIRVYRKHKECPCMDICTEAKAKIIALIKESGQVG
uniref:Uncharacterized protein n=1 Tax=Pithovirus LCDPAC01 TaxID=2506600 RepID=A0A481YN66_9VIRU|nr:MAG: hypothetical protein LCDPAC01_02090 [Pithovirus LCDPAC01]